jgi:TRAP-type C4-dicarboxylate transport system substrate-binding protein
MRTINSKFALITICLILLLGTAIQSYAAEKPINLRAAYFIPANADHGKNFQGFLDELAKRSNGKITISSHPGGTLVPVQQTYDAVIDGIADIGFGIFAYHKGRFPLTEVLDFPLGYYSAYTPTIMINEYYKKFKPKEMDDVKILWLEASSPSILNTKKPIKSVQDVAGMKIRCTGVTSKVAAAIGGVPVGVPVTEAYDALSKGVAEGTFLDIGGVKSWGLSPLVKFHIYKASMNCTASFYSIMNKDKWNSLSPDLQEIIDHLAKEWIVHTANFWKMRDENTIASLKSDGNQFLEITPKEDALFAEKVQPLFDEYVKAMKAKGLPGEEVVTFCRDYLKANN